MKTLLKDTPEFAERIENSYLLGEEIKDFLDDAEFEESYDAIKDDVVSDIVDELKEATFTIVGGEVRIEDAELLAQSIWKAVESVLEDSNDISISNKSEIAVAFRDKFTDFVNQNYTWKGIAK